MASESLRKELTFTLKLLPHNDAMMRPQGRKEPLEFRLRTAVVLYQLGMRITQGSEWVCATPADVSRWKRNRGIGGTILLIPHAQSARPSRRTKNEKTPRHNFLFASTATPQLAQERRTLSLLQKETQQKIVERGQIKNALNCNGEIAVLFKRAARRTDEKDRRAAVQLCRQMWKAIKKNFE